MRKKASAVVVILIVLTSGCQAPNDTRLTCKYDQVNGDDIEDEWLANNITSWDELPNETKKQLTKEERESARLAFRNINSNDANLTMYEKMPERGRELFIQLINNETSVGDETYPNSIYVGEVNERTVSYLTERKFFIYQNDIYFCGTATPQGA